MGGWLDRAARVSSKSRLDIDLTFDASLPVIRHTEIKLNSALRVLAAVSLESLAASSKHLASIHHKIEGKAMINIQ
jgi:hypothetical protein